jgi:DNA polymerase-3 subunit beta
MELQVRTMSLRMKCARFESNIKGIDASEFPLIATAEGENALQLPAPTVRSMIEQVVFAAAPPDESRVSLTGALVRFEGDRITMAATDGFRLSVRRTVLPAPVPENMTVIVPARAMAEVARISGEADPDKMIEISVAGARNQVLFRMLGKPDAERGGFHQVQLVSQLIDAKFPDYNAILPKNFVTRTVLDTAAFSRAVRAASFFVPGTAKNVRLQVTPGGEETPGQLALRANSAEVGDSATEVDAMVEGTGVEIAFNARYLIDALGVVDTPQVVLETTQANRPGVLRPVGQGPDEFTHVIMPMQLPR